MIVAAIMHKPYLLSIPKEVYGIREVKHRLFVFIQPSIPSMQIFSNSFF